MLAISMIGSPMMLNKKALLAAEHAYMQALRETGGREPEISRAIRCTLEAFIAALPDEGEIVAILRQRCSDLGAIMGRDGAVDSRIDKNLMKRAADALEVVRAKSGVPEGWRLVPKEPTLEWIKNLHNISKAQDIGTGALIAKMEIEAVLAAAPEVSDDPG
jgi:hypothetical protein